MVFEYDLEFINDSGRGNTGRYFGLIMEEYPNIPAATQEVEQIRVPGHDGELVRKGDRSNIAFSVPLTSLVPPKSQLEQRDLTRNVKNWLRGFGYLKFSDNNEARYRVLHVEVAEDNRITPTYGKYEVNFLIEPYEYAEDGFIEYTDLKFNGYDICKPIYKIYGERAGTITVNGIEIAINVGQNLTIDTYRQLTYRTDTTELINQGITGDYEELWLDNGPVIISASSGLSVKVIPRWGWIL